MSEHLDRPLVSGFTIEPGGPDLQDEGHPLVIIGVGNPEEAPVVYLEVCGRCFADEMLKVIRTGEQVGGAIIEEGDE